MYSIGIAYLLWFLSGFGILGFHRFYLGKFYTGFLWMFTFGLGTVGAIHDFLTLPVQVQTANIHAMLSGSRPRAGRPKRQSRGAEQWRYADDIEVRVIRKKESLERSILRLAKENKGVLAISEVALAADVNLEEARKALDTLVSKGFAELRVRKSGTLAYTLPEFMGKDEDLEDF
ncbi:MAG: NINE protein [Treponema sp.]|jgi:predicted transcriptional regulator|nr:NINE protein [Treponema sp.]